MREEARETPVIAEADVVVVGGGISGLAAAVAAAKNGAKVTMIERADVLGGTVLGGSSVLNSFTNHYQKFPDAGKHQYVRGFGQEIIDRMAAAKGCPGFVPGMTVTDPEAPRLVIMLPEIWKRVTFAMLREYGITLLTRTMFCDVIHDENGDIAAITVQNKGGRGAIRAKRFIDTSGDGDLAARAGCEVLEEHDQEHIKETTLVFGLNNVDVPRLLAWGERTGAMRPARDNGTNEVGLPVRSMGINLKELPATAEKAKELGIRMLWMIAVGGELFHVNTTRVRAPRGTSLLSHPGALDIELQNRHQMEVIVEMIREHIEGFENAYIHATASHFGIRRTRTVKCEYDVQISDVVDERAFPDEIGRFGYQDLPWDGYHPKNGGSYGVPYRAIVPTKVDNILVAGRLITTDWTAHMSTRNTGCCIVQGQAAGTAAALSLQHGVAPRDLDVALLQDALEAQGVYLERDAHQQPEMVGEPALS